MEGSKASKRSDHGDGSDRGDRRDQRDQRGDRGDPRDQRGDRGDDALLRYIERFALVLTETGWPRMPARVFACLLCEDSGRLTAGELASRLRVSPAAVSGAVRYLTQLGMVSREREPGARTDHYLVGDDALYDAVLRSNDTLVRWDGALAEGVELLGTKGGGRRLQHSREFFAFLHEELQQTMVRWRERQRRRSRVG
jgi:DNA-binding transcriptional ArsR family regulator